MRNSPTFSTQPYQGETQLFQSVEELYYHIVLLMKKQLPVDAKKKKKSVKQFLLAVRLAEPRFLLSRWPNQQTSAIVSKTMEFKCMMKFG